MILPPRIDQNDTIGILKDEPVVEEKKQIKRNPPNSLASEQSTQATLTSRRQKDLSYNNVTSTNSNTNETNSFISFSMPRTELNLWLAILLIVLFVLPE